MTYIFALAGCLLGFIGLVFGWRAARWALAAILFVPLFLVGDIFLLPLLWEPGGPFVAAAPPAPEPASFSIGQTAASQPAVALPVIPGLKIGDPNACGLPFGTPCPDPQAGQQAQPAAASQPAPAPAATCPSRLFGPLYGPAGVITYVCTDRQAGTGLKIADWYWPDGSKCPSGYDYFSVSPNATSDLDICLRQGERTDTPYEKALQALAPVELTPLSN